MTEAPTRTASTRSRKVKALLAGGLVLGVGAAVTLAAWTDQEWAEGVFGAGSFSIEGMAAGEEEFTDHESSGGAADLTAELTGADNLSPDTTIAMPFTMRLSADTTYGAAVVLNAATSDETDPQALSYGIVQVPSATECTAEATGEEILPSGTALNSVAGAAPFFLDPGSDTAAGDPVTLCIQVTAGDDLTQGQDATANWQFVGTSAE